MNLQIAKAWFGSLFVVFALSGCDRTPVGNTNDEADIVKELDRAELIYIDDKKVARRVDRINEIPVPYRGAVALVDKKHPTPRRSARKIGVANLLNQSRLRSAINLKIMKWSAFRLQAEITHRAAWTARLVSFKAEHLAAFDRDSDRRQRLKKTIELLKSENVSRETSR
jgi:hypothetical protein